MERVPFGLPAPYRQELSVFILLSFIIFLCSYFFDKKNLRLDDDNHKRLSQGLWYYSSYGSYDHPFNALPPSLSHLALLTVHCPYQTFTFPPSLSFLELSYRNYNEVKRQLENKFPKIKIKLVREEKMKDKPHFVDLFRN